MSPQPLVSVIIISYNTRDITLRCLRELYSTLRVNAEVIVVDNASLDGSSHAIAQAFPQAVLVRNDRNVGFSTANNQGMRLARGQFFLLLNSDAFMTLGALEELLRFLDLHPRCGVAGPRLHNADGTLQRSCHRFPTPARAWLENLWISAILPNHPTIGGYDRWDHNSERFVDFVSGACMLVRRTAYQEAGGFDEAFFMYAEETDWLKRMHEKGWQVGFTPAAVVTHLGGASGGATNIQRYVFDSLDRYQRKHHGVLGLLSLRLAMIVGNALRTVLWGAALLSIPKLRKRAASKLKLSSWLLIRQTTTWRSAIHP